MNIRDIANLAGVGVSTVSRVINNKPDVNEETREKVLEVIKKTKFVPNNNARNLKKNNTNSIGVLVKGVFNPFFTEMIDVISKEVLNYRSNKEEVLSLKHSKGTNVSFVFNDAIGLKIKEEYYSKVSNMEFKVEDFKNDNIESIRYIDDLFVTNNKLVLKLKKDGQHYIKDSLECVKNLDFVENAYRLTPSML